MKNFLEIAKFQVCGAHLVETGCCELLTFVVHLCTDFLKIRLGWVGSNFLKCHRLGWVENILGVVLG